MVYSFYVLASFVLLALIGFLCAFVSMRKLYRQEMEIISKILDIPSPDATKIEVLVPALIVLKVQAQDSRSAGSCKGCHSCHPFPTGGNHE